MKSETISADTLLATAILFVACAEHVEGVPDQLPCVRHLVADDALTRKVKALVTALSFDDFLILCQKSLREEEKLSLLLNLHDHCEDGENLSVIARQILKRFTDALGHSVHGLDRHLAALQVKRLIWQV